MARTKTTSEKSSNRFDTLLPWLSLAAFIIILDQLSKTIINQAFAYGERHSVAPLLDLILVYNKGAAFSFLSQASGWQRWFFIGLGLVATLVIAMLLVKHGKQKLFSAALTLIMAGALGNVIDRILHGHVIDFILLHYAQWSWPAFNIADSAITLGTALLIFDELRRVRKST